MAIKDYVIFHAQHGANASAPADALNAQAFQLASNVIIKNGLPTTRFGARHIPLAGEDAHFLDENMQGAKWFNPARGQSAHVFSDDLSRIMLAVGGRKYEMAVRGEGQHTIAYVIDKTTGFSSDRNLHLVYWTMGETYAIASDGYANTWIYDTEGVVKQSGGFKLNDKPNSELPNGATVGVYAYGRIHLVVDGHWIHVSNHLHESNLTNPANILKTSQQAHWNGGPSFSPPSQLGEILAGEIFPLSNTPQGHSGMVFHCVGGAFKLNTNVYPRESWSVTSGMVEIIPNSSWATGPYALDISNGDHVFRSLHGISTIRNVVSGEGQLLNPDFPISDAIREVFEADYAPLLRFASLTYWTNQRRLLCTISPVMDRRWRWHRGLVSLNLFPLEGARTVPSWEGIMTLSSEYLGITQLVKGTFGGKVRQFALALTREGKNSLVEFDPSLKCDVLPDGSTRPIESQLLSRKLNFGFPGQMKSIDEGKVIFDEIDPSGFSWSLCFRTDEQKNFRLWQEGGSCKHEESFDWHGVHDGRISTQLGEIANVCGEEFEFLIKWKGHAKLKGMMVSATKEDEPEFREEDLCRCEHQKRTHVFNPYEYGEAA